MITTKLNEHLETLAGYVFDDDKLVTYKWLSKELCIHVNTAKQILWEFYNKYKNNNNNNNNIIECTYLLIGHLKDEGMRVEVVRESDVTKAKEKFRKIISEHVYSVHKPIADLELLATSGSGDVRYSAINCDACKERSDEEMHLFRWGTAAVEKVSMENMTNSTNPSVTEKNSTTAKKKGFDNLCNIAGKSPEKSSFRESDWMRIEKNFSKEKDLTRKNEDSTVDRTLEEAKEPTKDEKDNVKKDKNFAKKDKNFFKDSTEKIKNSTRKNKGFNSVVKKVTTPQITSVKKGRNLAFGKLTSPSKSVEATLLEKKNVKKEFIKGKVTKKKKNLHGQKRNGSIVTEEIVKKRKTLVIQIDSSDSESDVKIEKSISEPKTQSRSPPKKCKYENGKRKVLKLINRTYEQGEYIVMEKERVYVTCSEEEEERREEKKAVEIEKVKRKQSLLTDFFKRRY